MINKPIVLNKYKHISDTTRLQFLQENSDPTKKEFSFKRFKTEKERIVRFNTFSNDLLLNLLNFFI